MYFSFTTCTMGELKMTEYAEVVAKRKLYLASEEWGNKIAQHYVCSGDVGDIGFGMGYFIYYNNGAVHKMEGTAISIVQKANSIEQVMDDYGRHLNDSK